MLCVECLFVCVLLFFFCKQRTADERRISDWSADVCSSDLGSQTEPGPGLDRLAQPRLFDAGKAGNVVTPAGGDAQHGGVPAVLGELGLEIGRASGRERVCQYV